MSPKGNNYISEGKRLCRLKEYVGLLLPKESPVDHIDISPFGLVNDEPDAWCPVDAGDGFWAAMPGPEFCPRLYRGQNFRHIPCKASIFRNASVLNYLINIAKLLEFYWYCESHPGVNYLRSYEIMGKKGVIDFESQAQHYGLPTTIVDFSRSHDVADFFARCRKVTNKEDGLCLWEVIPKAEFGAVMYTVDLRKVLSDDRLRKNFILTGPSPFLRPHRQKAVGLQLRGDCLTKQAFVKEERLEYSEDRALELLEIFSAGRFLFPNDVMSPVARRLCETKEIFLEAFQAAVVHVQASAPLETLIEQAESLGYTFTRKMSLVQPKEWEKIEDEWLVVSQEISKTMRIRLVADHLHLD